MFYQPKKMFAGHTKVLGGPDVAQAWSSHTNHQNVSSKNANVTKGLF